MEQRFQIKWLNFDRIVASPELLLDVGFKPDDVDKDDSRPTALGS